MTGIDWSALGSPERAERLAAEFASVVGAPGTLWTGIPLETPRDRARPPRRRAPEVVTPPYHSRRLARKGDARISNDLNGPWD